MNLKLHHLAALLVFGLTACASDAAIDTGEAERDEVDAATGEEDVDFGAPLIVRVDAYPSDTLLGTEVEDGFRVLPATSPRFRVEGSDIDLGTLQVEAPVRFTGGIEGFRLNPQISTVLPGRFLPVPATVRLWLPGTVQDYVAPTNEDGRFAAWVAPQAVYTLTVRSEDPAFPNYEDLLSVTESPRDIELELPVGVPVFGQVTTSSGPIVGARVHLVDENGLESAVALTDEDGRYSVRTLPGSVDVVCDGGDPLRRPVITHRDVVVDETGALVDFDYFDAVLSLVSGRVVTDANLDLAGAEVRFRSENLLGYDDGDAVWTFDARLQQGESFLAQVLPGSYDIEVVPPQRQTDALGDPFGQAAAPDVSPERLPDVLLLDREIELPEIELIESALVLGEVVDVDGRGVEATQVECAEVGFGQRQWAVLTDVFGAFSIRLPQVPMRCRVTPPGDSGLAGISFGFVPGEREGPTVVLPRGVSIRGRVQGPDGQFEQFAAIRVRRDSDGVVLGTALTDQDGRYEVRIAP